jgi:hypothetical protein
MITIPMLHVVNGKKADEDELIPSVLETDDSSKERRKNWARLIQKTYEVDPLTCPKCSGTMKVISVIEDEEAIKKILNHLGMWPVESLKVERERKTRPPPKAVLPEITFEYKIDYSSSQLLPDSDKWLYVDTESAYF